MLFRSGLPHPDRPGQWLPSPVPNMTRPGIVLPEGVKRLTILGDADGRDPRSTEMLVRRAASRFAAAGVTVRTAWPEVGSDFNDMLAAGFLAGAA